MGSSYQNISGAAELDRALKVLPAKLEVNVLRGGMRAGAKAVEKIVFRNVPYRLGHLRATVRSSVDKKYDFLLAKVAAGGGRGFPAPWLEFGTKAHFIDPKNRGVLHIGSESGGFVGDDLFFAHVQVKGVKPMYFMTRSMDTGAPVFYTALSDYVRTRLDKELGKLT